LYIASRLSKPMATFATLRLIDQCDDATIATTDLIAVRLPRTTTLDLPADASPGWWESAQSGEAAFGRDPTMRADLSFHGSDEGCLPMAVPASRETRFF